MNEGHAVKVGTKWKMGTFPVRPHLWQLQNLPGQRPVKQYQTFALLGVQECLIQMVRLDRSL